MLTLTVFGIGLLLAAGALWWSLAKHRDAPLVDPTTDKRRLVRAVAARPALAGFVSRRLDRSSAGGFMLTVGFGFVFVAALFVAWVFDLLEESRGFAEFDDTIAEWGAANSTELSTSVLSWITDLGGTAGVALVATVVGVVGWWQRKNVNVLFFMLAVVVGQSLVNNALKLLIERDRPDVGQLVGWAGSSFPSGHSAAAAATWAAVALILGLGRSQRVRSLLYAAAAFIAVAVAATRALLGVHWLTDVLAGLAVGWAWFVVCAVAFGGRVMQFGEPRDEVAATVTKDEEVRANA